MSKYVQLLNMEICRTKSVIQRLSFLSEEFSRSKQNWTFELTRNVPLKPRSRQDERVLKPPATESFLL